MKSKGVTCGQTAVQFYIGSKEENIPITPNHMIFGYALPTIAGELSEISYDDEDYLSTINKRLKYIATIKANMWRRWTRDYIQGLQEYQRHNVEKGKVPEIGEIVLVVDSSIKRRNWRMGKVTDLLKSRDGNVRAVKLQLLSHGSVIEIERPLQGVVSLELKGPLKEPVSAVKSTSGMKRQKQLATFAGEELRGLQAEYLNQED